MILPPRRKAVAYITKQTESSGFSLLVFDHIGIPGAGIQVPAGTIEPGEAPKAAALREAFEETGLAGLALAAPLGVRRRDMREFGLDEIHERHYFHLTFLGVSQPAWLHAEDRASDGDGPYLFRCFWAPLPDGVPRLTGGQGDLLPALLDRLALISRSKAVIANASQSTESPLCS